MAVSCECRVCEYGRLFQKNLDELSDSQREFWLDMYDNLAFAEDEVAYYKSILDGKWPNARGILQHALTKCPE